MTHDIYVGWLRFQELPRRNNQGLIEIPPFCSAAQPGV